MLPTENYSVAGVRKDKDDNIGDFPTPSWATRALMEKVLSFVPNKENMICWEPSCNRGYMVRPLKEYFGHVVATDIADYNGNTKLDFLSVFPTEVPHPIHFVITNPPFHLAQEFIEKGLEIAEEGVAVLVRTSFLESKKRYEELFSVNPPLVIAQFVERVPMVKGRCDPKASTATSYCWLIWAKRIPQSTPNFFWIPPCRRELERDGDYQDDFPPFITATSLSGVM
jgi:hypothetical protein